MTRDAVREMAVEVHRLQVTHRDLKRTLEAGGRCSLAALGVLRSVQAHGPCVLGRLADDTGVDTSVVSRHVTGLVEAGLVERTVDPADGRAHPVSITPEGERVLAEVGASMLRRWDDALAHWTDAELADLAATLRRLRTDLDPDRDAPTAAPTQTKEPVPA
ncbi:hypothetical protein GCM10028777_30180 [Angustibacter speluncae]